MLLGMSGPILVALVSRADEAQCERFRRAADGRIELLDVHDDRSALTTRARAAQIVYGRVRAEELRELPELRWVQATWAGIENLPLAALRERGVVVTNVRGQCGTAIAEHALAGLWYWCRDFPTHQARQAEGRWGGRIDARLLTDARVRSW